MLTSLSTLCYEIVNNTTSFTIVRGSDRSLDRDIEEIFRTGVIDLQNKQR